MTATKVSRPNRPRLVLRVGITGARDIPPHRLDAIRRQLAEVLDRVRQEVCCLARMSEACSAYRLEPDRTIAPELRFLSPLAEGADRLAAEAALEHGYTLHVPMPFQRCDYARDFDHVDQAAGWDCGDDPLRPEHVERRSSRLAFHDLLAHAASTVELDGGRDDATHHRYDEARSYEAVGRFVARNCDLLIAVWSGRPGKGRGGTADIVQFAAETGPPVWWIHTEDDAEPLWLNDAADLRDATARRAGFPAVAAATSLRAYLVQLILPPVYRPEPPASLFERVVRIGRRPPPLTAFYAERALPRRRRFRAYQFLIKLAAGGYEAGRQDPPPPTSDPGAMFWYDAYQAPDTRAGEYAARYRSTYVWVFGFAALALICAAMALAMPHEGHFWHWAKLIATGAEFAALLLILALVLASIRREWHLRSIDYRLLAELYRKQQALALAGWSLSGRAVQALVERHEDGTSHERGAWVIWLFAAMSREAPMPSGVFDTGRCDSARAIVLRDLIGEQTGYHEGRMTLCELASRRFVRWGEGLFIAIIAIVLLKLVLLGLEIGLPFGTPLGLIATALPALTAAVIGVRAYAELEVLVEQSRRMKTLMERAERRLEHLDLSRRLASQDLGGEVLEVATVMLQDVEGWARLFRVKLVEAG